jgi:hypothetical protein
METQLRRERIPRTADQQQAMAGQGAPAAEGAIEA